MSLYKKGTAFTASGLSIVEVILSMVFISLAFLGLSQISNITGKSAAKNRLSALALSIESAILTSLQTEATFKDVKAQMATGVSPSGIAVVDDGKTLAVSGSTKYFSVDAKECSAADYNEPQKNTCLLKVEFDIKCAPATPYPDCRAAYRIAPHQTKSAGSAFPPLGAVGTLAFKDSDYDIVIPLESYVKLEVSSCSGDTSLAITGFNRDTGEVYCAAKPQDSDKCPNGTVAKSIKFIPNPSGKGGRFAFQCTQAFTTLSCEPNYALQQVNLPGLEPGGAKSGTCVFIGKKSVNARDIPPPGTLLTVKCPPNYKTKISCNVDKGGVVKVNGQEPYPCKKPCEVPCSDPLATGPCFSECDDTCYKPFSPPDPTFEISDGSPNGTCTFKTYDQYGSSTTGTVSIPSATCELTLPETRAAM